MGQGLTGAPLLAAEDAPVVDAIGALLSIRLDTPADDTTPAIQPDLMGA